MGAAISAAPQSAVATAQAGKALRFHSHRNQALPQGIATLRLAFFSTELGPDMRFDRMCVALTARPSASSTASSSSAPGPRFVMTQIDAAAIEKGELFEKQPPSSTASSASLAAASSLQPKSQQSLAYDCIIFPGGAVLEEQAAISDKAAQGLAQYVFSGGGWFGTCAGGATERDGSSISLCLLCLFFVRCFTADWGFALVIDQAFLRRPTVSVETSQSEGCLEHTLHGPKV
jgi:hypothetical protein